MRTPHGTPHPGFQEQAWRGQLGDDYTKRQTLTHESRRHWLATVLRAVLSRSPDLPKSVIEFGANVGANLKALRQLLSNATLIGVEPNPKAHYELARDPDITLAIQCSITETRGGPVPMADMAMTRGLLIHISPEDLPIAYDVLYAAARRYVLIAEYYNPKPVMIPYRGQENLLWKRDFAGEMMDRHTDLKLVDYGFIYHRDPQHPQDDVTWFLLEKRHG